MTHDDPTSAAISWTGLAAFAVPVLAAAGAGFAAAVAGLAVHFAWY